MWMWCVFGGEGQGGGGFGAWENGAVFCGESNLCWCCVAGAACLPAPIGYVSGHCLDGENKK